MYFLLIDLALYITINLQIRYSGATIKNLTFQKPSGIKKEMLKGKGIAFI